MNTHFQSSDLVFIATGLSATLISCLLFVRGRIKPALYVLIAAGFVLRLWMAFADPYINLWDEQFHAMVAKNMMEHPFHPMLYKNPVIGFQYWEWGMNHTWVHKPPLFLWQIAAAMKIFGSAYWVVRIPSVLLTTLCIPVLFRMGKLIASESAGYFAALLFAVMNLQINVVSGFLNTDHNDVVFMCYVLFSFWAWMEFMQSNATRKKWLLLTGIFSGMAILVKWLPGLLVYGAWFIAVIADKNSRASLKAWLEMVFAFFVTAIVSAPWFIYIAVKFPEETKATFKLQNDHLTQSLDHDGPWWYHFQLLKEDYGWWMVILLPVCLLLFLRQKNKQPIRTGIFAAIIFVYAFYSFVPTRMPLFCLPVSGLLYIVIADAFAGFNYFQFRANLREHKFLRPLKFLLLAFVTVMVFDQGRLEHFHTDRNEGNVYRPARIENKRTFEIAVASLRSPDAVIFNCGGYANGVACMFYTGNTAYSFIPNEEQYRTLKNKGVQIAVFDDTTLPDYLVADSTVIKIHYKLIRNGF
jgi:4-amino-4-deoxy-L-arabinose transferase